MLILVVASLLILFAKSCVGIVVPESLSNGLYIITLNDRNDAISREITFSPNADLSRVTPRQQTPPPLENPQPHCGSGDLDSGEFSSIQASFDTMCDAAKMYGPSMAIIMAQGNSIAYMCNFAGTNRCWRQEYDEANRILDNACGQAHIGSVYVDRWKKSYGRDVKGADIC